MSAEPSSAPPPAPTPAPAPAPAPTPAFKYLEHPKSWFRNTPKRYMPTEGDIVVFSVDPEASVAHLDRKARRAARKIATQKYVAVVHLVSSAFSLPQATMSTWIS